VCCQTFFDAKCAAKRLRNTGLGGPQDHKSKVMYTFKSLLQGLGCPPVDNKNLGLVEFLTLMDN